MKKKEMISFLSEHFRYNTMNSWNNATSYARNVKLHNLKGFRTLPEEVQNIVYEAIQGEGSAEVVRAIMDDFAMEHDYQYQMAFNGRSGGYIVLIRGGKKESEYKSHCVFCGQRNYKSIKETGGARTCGKCRKEGRKDYESPHYQVFTQPGKGIDDDTDFADWSVDDLRERVKLVKEFDKAVDDCIASFLDVCKEMAKQEKKNDYKGFRKYFRDLKDDIEDEFAEKIEDEDLRIGIIRNLNSILAMLDKKIDKKS